MDRRPENTFCALDDIVVEPAPSMRDAAWARQAADSQDLLELSRVLADAPQRALQRLVELAMQATAAGSAGLSLEEHDETGAYLRWVATAGLFSRYVNGTMPRDHSPCGTAMDRAQPLVMRDPVRYYTYVSQLDVPLRSVLLVPFARWGQAPGHGLGGFPRPGQELRRGRRAGRAGPGGLRIGGAGRLWRPARGFALTRAARGPHDLPRHRRRAGAGRPWWHVFTRSASHATD